MSKREKPYVDHYWDVDGISREFGIVCMSDETWTWRKALANMLAIRDCGYQSFSKCCRFRSKCPFASWRMGVFGSSAGVQSKLGKNMCARHDRENTRMLQELEAEWAMSRMLQSTDNTNS